MSRIAFYAGPVLTGGAAWAFLALGGTVERVWILCIVVYAIAFVDGLATRADR